MNDLHAAVPMMPTQQVPTSPSTHYLLHLFIFRLVLQPHRRSKASMVVGNFALRDFGTGAAALRVRFHC